MDYQTKKAKIRQEAIDWQIEASNKNYSYGELACFARHFEKLGKRFGLLREFRENAIC